MTSARSQKISVSCETTASGNTALGYQAGYTNSTGAYNTSLGYIAYQGNNTGSYNVLTGSVSMSYWYGEFVQSESVTAINGGYERIEEVYQIQKGDLFRFFNKESGQWDRSFEREVKSVYVPPQQLIINNIPIINNIVHGKTTHSFIDDTSGDNFWGWNNGAGRNMMGILLKDIIDEFKKELTK